jgi:fibronectin type 3 domain-containing protein
MEVSMKTKYLFFICLIVSILVQLSCSKKDEGPSASTDNTDTSIPNPPTNLTVTNVDDSSVRLSWIDASNNEKGFKIIRWSFMSGSGITIDLPVANSTTYIDAGLIAYQYRYSVLSYNTKGESASSNSVEIWVGAPIAAPTNLKATAKNSTSINLTWNQNSSNLSHFTIEKSLLSAASGFSSTNQTKSTSYTDAVCTAKTKYWYRVFQTSNQNIKSGYSNVDSATTIDAVAPPTNLSASWTGSAFTLTWTASTTPSVTYSVKRRSDGHSTSSVLASGIIATTYTDATASVGSRYYYSVNAVANGSNSSEYTSEYECAALYVYYEQENNGPLSWASNNWYSRGNHVWNWKYFELIGGYSGSYSIYNAALDTYYDHDIFRISLSPGQKITFSRVSGNVNNTNGMSVTLGWVVSSSGSSSESDVHKFAAGGETYTLGNVSYSATFIECYIRVSIPSGISGSNYDFIFSISQ